MEIGCQHFIKDKICTMSLHKHTYNFTDHNFEHQVLPDLFFRALVTSCPTTLTDLQS